MSDYTYTQTSQAPAFFWGAEPAASAGLRLDDAIDKVRTGDVKSIRAYLADGADINAADKNGWTLLHWAVKYRQLKVVADLITLGADPAKSSRNGWTPLAIAVKNGSPAIIQFLGQIKKKS
jgi:ankyrin repeat protein